MASHNHSYSPPYYSTPVCRECVETSIKNRNRKCPFCGEKFGQDDYHVVFFTK